MSLHGHGRFYSIEKAHGLAQQVHTTPQMTSKCNIPLTFEELVPEVF
jgi:hypothetical protein